MLVARLPGQGKGVWGRGRLSSSCSLCRDAHGVHQLAILLMELDAEDEASRLLAADALYRLGHLDDAHKALLVALSRRPQAAPVLVRLALLQLRRGFFYDANQVRRPQWATAGQVEMGHTSMEGARPPVAPTLHPTAQISRTLEQAKCVPAPGSATSSRCLTSLTLSLLVCALVLQVLLRIS